MKNILVIITKLSNGGAEKAITLLASNLSKKYNVKIVAFDNSKQDYSTDVEIIDLKTRITNNKIKKIINFIIRIYKVRRIKKTYNIDYTISFLPGPNIVNCFTKYKDKIIISVRNIQSKLKKSYFREIANQISFNKADKIVTVCESVKEDISNTYNVKNEKMITIYNTYDENKISEQKFEKLDKQELTIFKDNFVVITIGRLIEQKGQWYLIRAFKEVVKKIPNAKLVILGRGELKNYLQKVIEKNGLESSVYLYGFKRNPYKYMYNSDLFVLPSLYEGMSNVLLEAMSCELPIIATNSEGGNKEILQNDYGTLINKFDGKYYIDEPLTKEEINLGENIIEILKNKTLRDKYKEQSQKRIKYFNKENNLKKWINLLDNI